MNKKHIRLDKDAYNILITTKEQLEERGYPKEKGQRITFSDAVKNICRPEKKKYALDKDGVDESEDEE